MTVGKGVNAQVAKPTTPAAPAILDPAVHITQSTDEQTQLRSVSNSGDDFSTIHPRKIPMIYSGARNAPLPSRAARTVAPVPRGVRASPRRSPSREQPILQHHGPPFRCAR